MTSTQPAAPPRRSTDVPVWLVEGARVATLRSDWKRNGHAPQFATVEKIGKRDVVLSDGQRFLLSRLTRRDGGEWGWMTGLLAADNPAVTEAAERAEYAARLAHARKVVEEWRFGTGPAQPADAIIALAALTGVEAQIRALFESPARFASTGGTDD